jgi:hypothetical protein
MQAGEFRDDDPEIVTRAILAAVDAMATPADQAATGRIHDYRKVANSVARFAVGGLTHRSVS